MKSPILILFIIFNLLAINLVSAKDTHHEETPESYLKMVHDDSTLTISIDESDCNHLCHLSSHLVGFISQDTQPSIINSAVTFIALNELFHSRTSPPPSQPPKA